MYARRLDRRYPPVFVGRHAELELVKEPCRRSLARCRQGKKTAGHIIVFRGAPGAGKSSMLDHIEEHWNGKNERPLALNLAQV